MGGMVVLIGGSVAEEYYRQSCEQTHHCREMVPLTLEFLALAPVPSTGNVRNYIIPFITVPSWSLIL